LCCRATRVSTTHGHKPQEISLPRRSAAGIVAEIAETEKKSIYLS
jgi:hypothetical protein